MWEKMEMRKEKTNDISCSDPILRIVMLHEPFSVFEGHLQCSITYNYLNTNLWMKRIRRAVY